MVVLEPCVTRRGRASQEGFAPLISSPLWLRCKLWSSPCIDWGFDMKHMMDVQKVAFESGSRKLRAHTSGFSASLE